MNTSTNSAAEQVRRGRLLIKALVALLLAILLTALLNISASAEAATTPVAIATPPAAPASTLSQAETQDSPGVVLVSYEVSATAQNVSTGRIYNSLISDGPLTTSWIGTGFFVSSDGFIVTAGHVAAPTPDQVKLDILTELYSEALSGGQCNGCGNDPEQDAEGVASSYALSNVRTAITVYTQDQNLANNPNGLTAELVQSSPVTENDTAVIKVQGSNFPVLAVGDSDAASVGDPIAVIGYPSTAIDNVDLSTLTSPTITSGTITNKPSQGGFQRLQSDATAEHGNSGGPMINAAGQVIGIVSNGPTSTTNFFIPSNAVKVVMREAGVDNAPGTIDTLWRNGLAAYNARHYQLAAQLFSQCSSLNKAQVGCVKYDALAVSDFGQDVPASNQPTTATHRSSDSTAAYLGIGLAALAVLATLAVVVRSRRRNATPNYPPSTGPLPAYPAHYQQPVATERSAWTPPPADFVPAAAPWSGAQPAQGWGGGAVATEARPAGGPKFCPECGTPMAGYDRCSRCGHSARG